MDFDKLCVSRLKGKPHLRAHVMGDANFDARGKKYTWAGNLTRLFSITENPPPFSGAYDDRSCDDKHDATSSGFQV